MFIPNYIYASENKLSSLITREGWLRKISGLAPRVEDLTIEHFFLIDFKFKHRDEFEIKTLEQKAADFSNKIGRIETVNDLKVAAQGEFIKLAFKGVYSDEMSGFALFLGETISGAKVLLFGSQGGLIWEDLPNQSYRVGGSQIHTLRPKALEYLKDKGILSPEYHIRGYIPSISSENALKQIHNCLYDENQAHRMMAILSKRHIYFPAAIYDAASQSQYMIVASPITVEYLGIS